MLKNAECEALAEKVYALTGADGAELILNGSEKGSTRFSNNAITQNMEESVVNLRLRVIRNGKQGVASGNRTDPDGLAALVAAATRAADAAEPDKSILPLQDKQPELSSNGAWDDATAGADARWRAEAVSKQVSAAAKAGFEAAGLLSTGSSFCGYTNSAGVRLFHRSTKASSNISAFAEAGNVEGSGDAVSLGIETLDFDAAAAQAIDRCKRGQNRSEIKPGKYDVVLTPEALSDLMLFMGWLGFSTQRHVEGRAALAGKLGTKVFSELLTMRSDPSHPLHHGRSFDYEGFATKPLTLIDKGVVKELPHDRRTAAKMSCENTGHGMAQPDTYGPMPGCIVVEGGTSSVDEMIAGIDNGLLVGQFHYTNTVDPMAMSVTGMTRGGLWRIEGGKVKEPLKNLRFTESLIGAFSNMDAVSVETTLKGGGLFGGGMVLPTVRIRGFGFSSGT